MLPFAMLLGSAGAVIGLCLFLRFVINSKGRRNLNDLPLPSLVPGAVPLLGNIFGLDKKRPHLTLYAWAKKYGDIFRFRVLNEDVVVVNSKDLIREALFSKGVYFAGRPYVFRIHYGFKYAKDIIFGDYTVKWMEMKKFATTAIKRYACGLRSVEDIVQEEMLNLKQTLTDHVHTGPFDPRVILLTSVVNSITASVIGRRFNHDDPIMKEFQLTTRLFSEACSPVNGMELDLFPWLRFLPNQNFNKLIKARTMIHSFVDTQLKELESRRDPENPASIMEALLHQVAEDTKSGKELGMTSEDVKPIFIDLLVAGTFTTAVTLSTFVLLMMEHQAVKARLFEELKENIGLERSPVGKDRENMPYFEATILEILRYISHVPLNLPHYTTADTTLGQHFIPAKTQVLLNLWHLHHDERVWTEPWQFRPERFLDAEGELLHPTNELRKSMLMFSGGRRACMGEALSRERLFLFSTLILQQFDIECPPGEAPPSSDPRHFELGLILEPKPFRVSLVPRK